MGNLKLLERRFPAGLFLALSLLFLLLPLASPFRNPLGFQVSTTLTVLSLVVGFLLLSGATVRSVKWVALVSILGSLSAVLRIPFAAIPSVQPCTFLVICSGYVLGPAAGFLVGTLTTLVSNMALGHGIWSLYQILGWGLAGALAPALRRLTKNASSLRTALIIFGFAWGYVFGLITNLSFWVYFFNPSLESFIAVQLASIWFDTVHAINNVVLLGLLGPKTIGLLEGVLWGKNRFN
jgi:energy-coupling factor transport system substrate-specific component